jgi:hypothetical protein
VNLFSHPLVHPPHNSVHRWEQADQSAHPTQLAHLFFPSSLYTDLFFSTPAHDLLIEQRSPLCLNFQSESLLLELSIIYLNI